MSDRMIRLMKMVIIIQANPGISAQELADKCETSERTIYRDLRTLDLVVPITNDGYGRGYRFIGNFAMYPLNFTEEEEMVFYPPFHVGQKQAFPLFDSVYDKVMATHVKEKQNAGKQWRTSRI